MNGSRVGHDDARRAQGLAEASRGQAKSAGPCAAGVSFFRFLLCALLCSGVALGASGSIDHASNRATLSVAFGQELGRSPTPPEAQILTAMSCHETGCYGAAFKRVRNNWGAIKIPGSIRLVDYDTPMAGARAFVRSTLGSERPKRAAQLADAIAARSTLKWATVLYDTHYFTGDPKLTREQRIRAYARNMMVKAREVSAALNEPLEISL